MRVAARARLALVLLALVFVLPTPQLDWVGGIPWNQGSSYALVRALASGTAQVDPYVWQTGDLALFHDHYYSVRAPAMAMLTVPVYSLLRAAGLQSEGQGENRNSGTAGMLWALTLVGAALPAFVLVLLVRHVVEALEPGFGTVVGITVGLGTLVLPFATMFFVHMLSACLGFAAFVLLRQERRGPPRTALVAAGGLVAGLAVVSEYALVLVAAVLAAYAVARPPLRLRTLAERLAAYGAGAALGVVPLLAYNRFAFGSPFHVSYADALSGSGRVGLNAAGFFGVVAPKPRIVPELLFSARGLLVLTPVLACAAVGLVLLFRKGARAEALVAAAVTVLFLAYDSGYWTPFGGSGPGPRFLIATIPFLALGLGPCFRRFPAPTLGLAGASVATMTIALLGQPLLPKDDTRVWREHLAAGELQNTVLSWLGAGHGWASAAPLLVAIAAAAVLAWRSAPGPSMDLIDVLLGLAAVAVWGLVALTAPAVLGESDGLRLGVWPLIAAAEVAGSAAVVAAALAQPRVRARLRPPQPAAPAGVGGGRVA